MRSGSIGARNAPAGTQAASRSKCGRAGDTHSGFDRSPVPYGRPESSYGLREADVVPGPQEAVSSPAFYTVAGEGMPQTRIIIVGGGFGGLAAAKALRNTPAQILLIDRTNHHLFHPLLYQVATSEPTPGQIGFPSRGILRNQESTTVTLTRVTGVIGASWPVFYVARPWT